MPSQPLVGIAGAALLILLATGQASTPAQAATPPPPVPAAKVPDSYHVMVPAVRTDGKGSLIPGSMRVDCCDRLGDVDISWYDPTSQALARTELRRCTGTPRSTCSTAASGPGDLLSTFQGQQQERRSFHDTGATIDSYNCWQLWFYDARGTLLGKYIGADAGDYCEMVNKSQI